MRDLLEEILADHTGQTDREDRQRDTDRDFVLSADRGQGVRHHRRGDLRPGARRQQRPDHGRQLTDRHRGTTTWPSSETAASC